MRVRIEIRCDNEAFEPYAGTEVARILRQIADEMQDDILPDTEQRLRDINGNTVGTLKVQK